MDPPRQSHNQPGRNPPVPPRRLGTPYTPDDQNRSLAQSSSHYSQQPSLPSIRQLHPYLPPSGMSQQGTLPDVPSSGYTYPPPTYPIASGSGDIHAGQSTQSHSNIYGRTEALESELEGDTDQQGPAKKKRRRQALSCNECKRRKIKCDRAQPCGPCTRRGEQSKCQWRTLEPVDKYVSRAEYEDLKSRSRAEYEELKARFEHLETVVSRFFSVPPGPVNVPQLYGMTADIPGAPPDAVSPFQAGHSTNTMLYQQSMPSSSFTQESSQSSHRFPRAESPRSFTSRTPHGPPSVLSQTPMQPLPPPEVRRLSDPKSPITLKQSPLSLASITSPYNIDAQSKNCRAQTLMLLGERLRPQLEVWKGPVARQVHTTVLRRWKHRLLAARPMFSWRILSCLDQACRYMFLMYSLDDIVIHPLFSPAFRLGEMQASLRSGHTDLAMI